MKKIIICFFLVFFVSPLISSAATPTASGPSGLLLVRTADILDKGSLYFNLHAGVNSYKLANVDKNEEDGFVTSGIHFSLIKNLELGITSSALIPDQHRNIESDVDYTMGTVKIRLLGSRDKGYGVSVTGHHSINREENNIQVSSGEDIYGGELNLSYFGEKVSFHLSAGSGQEDIKVTGISPSRYFVSQKRHTLSAALEITPASNVSISLEALAWRFKDDYGMLEDRENTLLMPSIKYTTSKNVTFMAGVALGIPDDYYEPEYKYIAGLSYAIIKPKVVAASSAKSMVGKPEPPKAEYLSPEEMMRQQIESLQSEIDKLLAQRALLQKDVISEKKEPEKEENILPGLKAEVINTSGIPGLGKKVADILSANGHIIVKLSKGTNNNRKKTIIRHHRKVMYEAVELGHQIPITQDVIPSDIRPRTKLPDTIDVRVLVGSDLKFLLKKSK